MLDTVVENVEDCDVKIVDENVVVYVRDGVDSAVELTDVDADDECELDIVEVCVVRLHA